MVSIVTKTAAGFALILASSLQLHAADRARVLQERPRTDRIDFKREIRPIFAKHCYRCHGAEEREGGLRLDIRSSALTGGDSGISIVPGESQSSMLIDYVVGADPDVVMPPEGERLSAKEIALLRAWIDQGAVWPKEDSAERASLDHWAYEPLRRPIIPNVKDRSWGRTPIDAFVLRKLETQGILPSPEADRSTLIRRLYLDLLGLPPEVEDVDRFLDDTSPVAYENLVERILQSPHFGERWGRHWLDKARYADSDGYEKDRPRPNAWRWRQWAIDAINQDMPFDQFTVEQLAGDLLPEATESQHLATAFHRQTLTNTEGGTDQEQFRVEAIFDRVETTGAVWLGLTVGCARCHSHKYDEIAQREYYQLFAFFNNADESAIDVPISSARLQNHQIELDQLHRQLMQARKKYASDFLAWQKRARQQIEKEAHNPVTYEPLKITGVDGPEGTTFETLDDGSIRVRGDNPAKADYVLTARTSLPKVVGFRIEALSDEDLPGGGPGRAKNGNFVLSEIEVIAESQDNVNSKADLKWSTSRANFAQSKFQSDAAIDGKLTTGWAISPKMGANHWGDFFTTGPIVGGDQQSFTITLHQQHGTQHTLGRYRIDAITGEIPDSTLPKSIRNILQLAQAKRTSKQAKSLVEHFLSVHPPTRAIFARLSSLRENPPLMKVRVLSQRTKDTRRTHVLRRGDFLQPIAELAVAPAGLKTLPAIPPRAKSKEPDRLDLARWLVSAENPLTPRVAVNHVWTHLFGNGLVGSVNDFGVRGELPTHPELLDWLAAEYQRLGWSRKALIRLIVSSSTYRQSSVHRSELADVDPNNRLLYRQNRFRVEAEIIRDASLSAAGMLSTKIGGPSVFPPMPKDIAGLSYANNFKWQTSDFEDAHRRGLYTFFKRTAPHPNLVTFDCPDSNTACVIRGTSNTPLQALTTLNNDVFVESSQAMAQRVLLRQFPSDRERLSYAYRLCVARKPNELELNQFASLLDTARSWYQNRSSVSSNAANDTEEVARDAENLVGPFRIDGVEVAESAAWVATVRIMMNLDAFVTRE